MSLDQLVIRLSIQNKHPGQVSAYCVRCLCVQKRCGFVSMCVYSLLSIRYVKFTYLKIIQ